MTDQDTPQSEAPQDETPTSTPPPPAAGSTESTNRGVMIVLSYLWILALIPLLVEKDDKEVQWHAKNGLVLTAAEFALWLFFNILAATGIGCVFVIFLPIIFVVFAVIRVIAIVKGLKGDRFVIPWLSDFVDKF
jgi:uncharacterized membrane protein